MTKGQEQKKKDQAGALKVTPPEGWSVHSPFGLLKTGRGQHLVRLEDVHAFVMQRDGLPSASAAARVFSVFVSDAASAQGIEHGAGVVRARLRIIDPADYAYPIAGLAGELFMAHVAEQMPYLPHHRFDRGTVEAHLYAVGVIAGEVWTPHGKALGEALDLGRRLDGYCPEGSVPSVAMFQELAGRFAVSCEVAHVLWGWGQATGANEQPEAAAGAPATPALQAAEVVDWPSLVRYRCQFVDVLAQQRALWSLAHVAILAAQLNEEYVAGRGRGALVRLAESLGVKRQALSGLLKKHKYNPATGEKQQERATVFGGLSERSKTGT